MDDQGSATGRRTWSWPLAGMGAWAARGAVQPAAAAGRECRSAGAPERGVVDDPDRPDDWLVDGCSRLGPPARARPALEGLHPEGSGVHGLSRDANGVHESVACIGVSGHTTEPGSTAVSGDSTNGVGVQGGSHHGVGGRGPARPSVAVRGGTSRRRRWPSRLGAERSGRA